MEIVKYLVGAKGWIRTASWTRLRGEVIMTQYIVPGGQSCTSHTNCRQFNLQGVLNKPVPHLFVQKGGFYLLANSTLPRGRTGMTDQVNLDNLPFSTCKMQYSYRMHISA